LERNVDCLETTYFFFMDRRRMERFFMPDFLGALAFMAFFMDRRRIAILNEMCFRNTVGGCENQNWS
jgi:hypothetical protein